MTAEIHLKNISIRFKKYETGSLGIKEAIMQKIEPPGWRKNRPARVQEFLAVKDLSLDILEGDRLGIIGRNGAGKSTLLKVISRIYRPVSGSVELKGRVAPLIEIGAGFNPELTGRENTFLNAAVLGIPRKTIEQHLDSIISFSELKEFFDTPVKYYSTGMYLKLAFTIATEVAPDILILDELYAGGDAVFIQKANRRLEAFVDRSKILILVAHDLNYIRRFCNKVIVMNQGEIAFCGSPEEAIERYNTFCQSGNLSDLKARGNA